MFMYKYSKPISKLTMKDSNHNAHVQVFKANIKVNNETIDEEIINLFNFTLKDNAFN
jgi:hypothetical protein